MRFNWSSKSGISHVCRCPKVCVALDHLIYLDAGVVEEEIAQPQREHCQPEIGTLTFNFNCSVRHDEGSLLENSTARFEENGQEHLQQLALYSESQQWRTCNASQQALHI